MTKNQFEYIYKRIRKDLKDQDYPSITRGEFRGFLGLLGVNTELKIDAEALAAQISKQLSETLKATTDLFDPGAEGEALLSSLLEANL